MDVFPHRGGYNRAHSNSTVKPIQYVDKDMFWSGILAPHAPSAQDVVIKFIHKTLTPYQPSIPQGEPMNVQWSGLSVSELSLNSSVEWLETDFVRDPPPATPQYFNSDRHDSSALYTLFMHRRRPRWPISRIFTWEGACRRPEGLLLVFSRVNHQTLDYQTIT